MFRPVTRLPLAFPFLRPSSLRLLHSTPATRLPTTPPDSERPNSQGHTTAKAQDSAHGDADIQTASVKKAQAAKADSQSSPDGSAQPYDAARQGGVGGEAKPAPEQLDEGERSPGTAGSFKDQVGGHDDPGVGAKMGGVEAAPDEGNKWDAVKGIAQGGMQGLKQMVGGGKSFSTLSRLSYPSPAPSDPSEKDGTSARQPHSDAGKLHGEQNEHLKHRAKGEKSSRAGNAAEEPHLPSQQAKAQQKRAFSTSAGVWATKPPGGYARAIQTEAGEAGYHTPPEASPANASSAYNTAETQPSADGLTPALEGYSSTASSPPNEALRAAAKEGTLGVKNPPPEPAMGEMGNKEAWKHRK